ncbi:MAG: riboflavin synthase subunit alpha [Sandaracinus sp.]|nr:riboflavin synthase subunit alpha [Sandaracinus sp.]MCB9635975.1 riboflavin synthase subunit alpha [Sandaracinus sp.]
MFTGITRGTFSVVQVEREPALLRFAVDLGEYAAGLELGASVSIDGVCQTVVALEGGVVRFDAIQETLDKTTLDALEVGRLVSVERSAKVGDEIGGHDVSGHVTGTGTIAERRDAGHDVSLTIEVPRAWTKYILPKGFVAIDGSSLTVGEVSEDGDVGRFTLYLIPETLRLTNLGEKQVGARVNVELDPRTVAIVATVERVLASRGL